MINKVRTHLVEAPSKEFGFRTQYSFLLIFYLRVSNNKISLHNKTRNWRKQCGDKENIYGGNKLVATLLAIITEMKHGC